MGAVPDRRARRRRRARAACAPRPRRSTVPGTLPAPRLYRVGYLEVKTPSSVEGHAGPWPDPLIPDVDAYAGEKRNAFPFDVPAGESRAIWVELFVPRDGDAGALPRQRDACAPTGRAAATVPIDARGAPLRAAGDVVAAGDLRHHRRRAVARAHPGLSAAATAQLVERYEVAALRHRISCTAASMEPAPWRRRTAACDRLRAYDAEVGPFLDGKADRRRAGRRARAGPRSTCACRSKLDGAERDDYLRQLVAHLRARGWLDRAVRLHLRRAVRRAAGRGARARRARCIAAAPEVPRLVTKELDARLRGAVDIWCPTVNYLDDKPGNSNSPPRAPTTRAGRGRAALVVPGLYEPRLQHRRRRLLHRLARATPSTRRRCATASSSG